MVEVIRPAWIGVGVDLQRPGPFDVYFVPIRGGPAHSTAFVHIVYFCGFPIPPFENWTAMMEWFEAIKWG